MGILLDHLSHNFPWPLWKPLPLVKIMVAPYLTLHSSAFSYPWIKVLPFHCTKTVLPCVFHTVNHSNTPRETIFSMELFYVLHFLRCKKAIKEKASIYLHEIFTELGKVFQSGFFCPVHKIFEVVYCIIST